MAKRKAVFGGEREKAQINCTCEERISSNISTDCVCSVIVEKTCSVIVEKTPGKVTPQGIVGGESVVIQFEVPVLQHLVKK